MTIKQAKPVKPFQRKAVQRRLGRLATTEGNAALEKATGDETVIVASSLALSLEEPRKEASLEQEASETDAGPDKQRRVSARRCALTRTHDRPERMLRLVVAPGGLAAVDLGERLPGRGVWLSARRTVLENPKLAQALGRAARREVKLPEEFVKLVSEGLARRLQDGISLARRAGEAVCGFQKCREKITAGKAGLVVCASGASPDELSRLVSGHRTLPVVWVPEKFLAIAFGRGKAVYAVVAPGALARRLKADCERFTGVADGALPDPAVRPAWVSKEQAEL